MFTELLTLNEVAARPDLVAGIEHEIELLSRKNSSTRKPTAHQEENEILIERIKAVLLHATNEGMTISEVVKALDDSDLTHSRINQLVKKLKDEGIVIRTEVKRRAYFKLSDEVKKDLED
nr:MAG TPA: Ftsk gamma domain [Caudoviricetes sp.]